jgi:hypothetical protein
MAVNVILLALPALSPLSDGARVVFVGLHSLLEVSLCILELYGVSRECSETCAGRQKGTTCLLLQKMMLVAHASEQLVQGVEVGKRLQFVVEKVCDARLVDRGSHGVWWSVLGGISRGLEVVVGQ